MTTLTRSILFALVILLALAAVVSAAPKTGVCPVIQVNARRGDTVGSIAGRYGTTSAAIVAANPGHDLYPLMAGQTISVPACRPARPRWPIRLVSPGSR